MRFGLWRKYIDRRPLSVKTIFIYNLLDETEEVAKLIYQIQRYTTSYFTQYKIVNRVVSRYHDLKKNAGIAFQKFSTLMAEVNNKYDNKLGIKH